MDTVVICRRPEVQAALKSALDAQGFTSTLLDDRQATSLSGWPQWSALVVLDTAGGDAWDLCRRVRSRPGGNLSLVWAVVDSMTADVIRKAAASEVDDCIAWPFDTDWLALRLAAAARRISAMEEIPPAKAELQASIERSSLAQRGSRAGVWDALPGEQPLMSPDTPVWYSPEMKELFGVSEEEFPNVLASWSARVHPDDLEMVTELVTRAVENKTEFEIEYRFRHSSGQYLWISGRGQGIYDEGGSLVRVTGSVRDITENRRVAEALQASEAQWRSLVENAPDIITVVARDGTIRFMNRAWPGMTSERSAGENLVQLAPTEQRESVRSALEEVGRSGRPGRFELTLPGADGKPNWFAGRVGPIHRAEGIAALVIITTDITLRKRAEEEREQFVATIENSTDFIGMMDQSGRFLHLNPAGCQLIGLQNQESAKKMALADVYTADCRPRYEHEILPAVYAEERWSGEIRFRNQLTDAEVDVHQKIFLIRNPQSGAPLCLATISRDIRARRRQEEALRQEQELLRKLLDLHERDRQLVAYEIHDGLAQEMAGALMHLQAFQHLAANQLEGAELERGLSLLRKAVQEARRLISGLRPPVLDEFGIIAAIEYLINEVRPDVPDVQFVHHTKFERLAPPLESAIFRIVQESLSNIRRHSGSRRAKIELFEHGQQLRLVVRDWGTGFDTARVHAGHFGLQGIQERGRLLGGKVIIESRRGQGTTLVVDLPLIQDRSEAPRRSGFPA